MNAQAFLTALASTEYGKLVCLNLYRACRAGLLEPEDVCSYFEDCSTELAAQAGSYGPSEVAVVIVRVSRSWQARERSSRRTRRRVQGAEVDATGVSTVAHLWSVLRQFKMATNSTYFDRNNPTADDFREFVDKVVGDNDHWRVGGERDYCWLASAMDTSMHVSKRDGTLAQLHCDILGLCHFGAGDNLVRLSVSHRGVTTVREYYRPNAFDGLDNAAFRATRESESADSLDTHGMTVDINKVRECQSNVDGTREWLGQSTDLPARDIVWEYLGSPTLPASKDAPAFHRQMFDVLGGQAAFDSALPYLQAALGDVDA